MLRAIQTLRFLGELFVGGGSEVLLNNHALHYYGAAPLTGREEFPKMLRKTTALILSLAILSLPAFAQQTAAPAPPAPPKTHLKVGQAAPDFTLTDTAGNEVKLSDFKGRKNVILAFYVLAFTGG
jgi:AhpC/TSA family